MPSKNSIKQYVEEGYYHLYNRGVNKMNIFQDKQDYAVFLSYLKTYLLPLDKTQLLIQSARESISARERDRLMQLMRLHNYSDKISLLTYCLMPNHYHLLIQQKSRADVEFFMRSLMTRYTQYFNRKNKRRGPLYEGRYKAVLVDSDLQLLHLTRYIHRNPLSLYTRVHDTSNFLEVLTSQPTSYLTYVGHAKQVWVKPEIILSKFSLRGFNSYQAFVEDGGYDTEIQNIRFVSSIAIDL